MYTYLLSYRHSISHSLSMPKISFFSLTERSNHPIILEIVCHSYTTKSVVTKVYFLFQKSISHIKNPHVYPYEF